MSKTVYEKELKTRFWESKKPKPVVKCTEIIKNSGWVLSNVFSEEECKAFIAMGNKIGYNSLKGNIQNLIGIIRGLCYLLHL